MREIIATDGAPKAVGPYSQAVISDGWVWVSMQIPLDPATGMMVEGDIREKARRVFGNIQELLEKAGTSLAEVVRTTLYLVDMDDFAAVNSVYEEAFSSAPPARAALQVVALPLGARVAIDAVARVAKD
jgi:2-iminobutanoate/2-iminopropanoate deaminase